MLNDPKIAFMTTLGVNVGDEFIREGIFSFFDEIFASWTPFYVNKHDLLSLRGIASGRVDHPGQQVPGCGYNCSKRRSGLLENRREFQLFCRMGRGVVGKAHFCAWPAKADFEHCGRRLSALSRFRPHFSIRSSLRGICSKSRRRLPMDVCRDPLASQILCALGIEHEALPCAALHAARRTNFKGTFGGVVGVNLMPLGGHFRLRDDFDDDVWNAVCQALVKLLRKHHRLLFIAHDASEKAFMERYRSEGEVIFLSGSWRDYLHVYAKSSAVVSNRVHGAVCAAGFGRPAVIIGNDTRLMIGDFIGIPSLYAMEAKAGQVVDLIEDGIRGQKAEGERLIQLREESADSIPVGHP